jgi:hypothetical protein
MTAEYRDYRGFFVRSTFATGGSATPLEEAVHSTITFGGIVSTEKK